MSNERFTTPSSFADEPEQDVWPEGLRKPVSGDPFYEETMAAVYGYTFNGRRYRIGADGKPEEIDTNAKHATPQSGDTEP